MLRLKGSKTIAALMGGLALMAVSMSAAQADNWKGHGHGNDWGHGKNWHKGHRGWDGGPNVVIRNGYYYAPPPRVYYAPPPVFFPPPAGLLRAAAAGLLRAAATAGLLRAGPPAEPRVPPLTEAIGDW